MARRILIATDEPFWQRNTGARQRIAALVDFFHDRDLEIHVFFLCGPPAVAHKAFVPRHIHLHAVSSDQPPQGMLRRALWSGAGAAHRVRQWLERSAPPQQQAANESLTLADFRWPWAIDRFSEVVARVNPEFVLIEYVKMAYLLEGIPEKLRPGICRMIDTHDLLHQRADGFQQHGFSHWLKISRQEEAEVLREFDVVLAIQEQEAVVMREMAPESNTIVATHSLQHRDPGNIVGRSSAPGKPRVVGYLASANYSNWSAIRTFLKTAWPVVNRQSGSQLLIAGGICDWFENGPPDRGNESFPLTLPDGVNLAGMLDDVADFYRKVDLVINPVEFGTGLKIKNCEALWFGKPLVTTNAGSAAMPEDQSGVVAICNCVSDMAGVLVQWLNEEDALFARKQTHAATLARYHFSDDCAYRGLYSILSGYPEH